ARDEALQARIIEFQAAMRETVLAKGAAVRGR
ncbi:MAG TPA: 5-(carboxyamino)imidazole ribonucleotide mutase, partial [Propionibacteriaceae bacterium]|nr:5-(carboxyamino)imidazole ribonucleotide mutase [Propionibacteriaceae bacterium]